MSGFMPPPFHKPQCVMIKCMSSLNFTLIFALTKSNSRSVVTCHEHKVTKVRLQSLVAGSKLGQDIGRID
jgi:hypothetical protein